MNSRLQAVFAVAIALPGLVAHGQVFSLDDNPDNPLTAPAAPGFLSAEHPFPTLGAPPTAIGPSPTLVNPLGALLDSDLLYFQQGTSPRVPTLELPVIWAHAIDALSTDHSRTPGGGSAEIRLRFSIDRLTRGRPGTNVEAQAFLNQQAADIFRSGQQQKSPLFMVGTLAGATPCPALPSYAGDASPSPSAGTAFAEIQNNALGLTAGTGVGNAASGAFLCPPHAPGTHDNIDALNMFPLRLDADQDGFADLPTYYSIPPAYAAISGLDPANILSDGFGAGGFTFATAAQCGLQTYNFALNEGDDIDALIVWSHVPTGFIDLIDLFAEPGDDFALFSLSPGSRTLDLLNSLCGVPADGSTVFFTDFTGRFKIYAFGSDIGIADRMFPALGEHANIDALEIWEDFQTGCGNAGGQCADTNLDGSLDPADFNAWILAFNTGNCVADQNGDGLIDPSDFNAWISNYNNGGVCP